MVQPFCNILNTDFLINQRKSIFAQDNLLSSLFQRKAYKSDEKYFLFHIKSSFCSKIFKFCLGFFLVMYKKWVD